MTGMMRDSILLSGWLAVREATHHRATSLCQIFIVCALVAPVTIVLAVREGVVADLRAHLSSFPENLRLTPLESVSRPVSWFESMRRDPRVGFIAPHPYTNADELVIEHPSGKKRLAALLASGDGDLFLPDGVASPGVDETVLTAALAEALGAAVGDTVVLIAERPWADARSPLELKVIGITPRSRWASEGALLHEDVLVHAWQWRQGRSSELFGMDGEPWPDELRYPQFRLFAASLADLAPLAAELRAGGIPTTGRFAAAELADSIERSARTVVLAVAVAAGLGAAAALAASLLADAARLGAAISTLRSDGLAVPAAAGMLVIKAAVLAGIGAVVGVSVYAATRGYLDRGLALAGLPFDASVRLGARAGLGVVAVSVAVAVLASLLGAARIGFAPPSDRARED